MTNYWLNRIPSRIASESDKPCLEIPSIPDIEFVCEDIKPVTELAPITREVSSTFHHVCGYAQHQKPKHPQIDLDMAYIGGKDKTDSAYVRDVMLIEMPDPESNWAEYGTVVVRLKMSNDGYQFNRWLHNFALEEPWFAGQGADPQQYAAQEFGDINHKKSQTLIWNWGEDQILNDIWLMRDAYIDHYTERHVDDNPFGNKEYDLYINYKLLKRCPNGPR